MIRFGRKVRRTVEYNKKGEERRRKYQEDLHWKEKRRQLRLETV